MTTWAEVMGDLLSGRDLDRETAYAVMDQVMMGELGDVRLASFLTALSAKGAGVSEVHGLADAMQDHAESVDVADQVLDIVGTGGDRAHTVNISTMSAIVLAGAGVPVVKHGNRASTSASGSADVLEALGLNLDLAPQEVGEVFEEVGITFLFANKFHPSMRFAAGVRRQLPFPTVFNVLGPLTNPARPAASAVGVAQEANAPLMAGVFAERGTSALVFRGHERGLDELTTTESSQIWQVSGGVVEYAEFDAVVAFGLPRSSVGDLQGGSATQNAQVALDVLAGAAGPVRDAVLLNAAAGIVSYALSQDPTEGALDLVTRLGAGVEEAAASIDSGAANDVLTRWIAATRR